MFSTSFSSPIQSMTQGCMIPTPGCIGGLRCGLSRSRSDGTSLTGSYGAGSQMTLSEQAVEALVLPPAEQGCSTL